MPVFELVGGPNADGLDVAANPSRLINCYREPVAAGGQTRHAIKSVPGQVSFCTLPDPVGRALGVVNGRLYAVAGKALHEIDAFGSATLVGNLLDDAGATIAGYSDQVTLAAGGRYYVWDGSTFSEITGGAFAAVASVAYLSGYTILTEKNGGRFEWTALQNPKSRDPLNVATAEARDDDLLRAVALGGNLYLFGERSIEIWSLTGQAGAAAFGRLSGGVIDRGARSADLIVSVGDSAFFVGDDNVPYLVSGASLTPLVGAGIMAALRDGAPTHCLYYEDAGHKFCVIRFSDRPAWTFDIATGEWHERASGNDLSAWPVLTAANAYGGWVALDENGVVSKLQRVNSDLGGAMIRRIVSRTIDMQGRRFRVPLVEVRGRVGTSASRETMVMLSTSRDGGMTWGAPAERSFGRQGEYDRRAVWRNRGQFRRMTMRIDVSEPEEVPIWSDCIVEVA